jgi:phosphoenolpyruvate carboxykinase (ATP)
VLLRQGHEPVARERARYFQALRFVAVLENVVLEEDHEADFTDTSITKMTRGAYPINFIKKPEFHAWKGIPPM